MNRTKILSLLSALAMLLSSYGASAVESTREFLTFNAGIATIAGSGFNFVHILVQDSKYSRTLTSLNYATEDRIRQVISGQVIPVARPQTLETDAEVRAFSTSEDPYTPSKLTNWVQTEQLYQGRRLDRRSGRTFGAAALGVAMLGSTFVPEEYTWGAVDSVIENVTDAVE